MSPRVQYRSVAEMKERLVSFVEVDPNSGCWLWAYASTDPRGYGRLHVNGRREKAHRASYEAFCGPIPRGGHVLHGCDTPPCINPDHLRIGTAKDNADDRERRGRGNHAIEGRHPKAKLTAEQVSVVRCRAREGVGLRRLARDFGVTHATIRAIVERRTWRTVP